MIKNEQFLPFKVSKLDKRSFNVSGLIEILIFKLHNKKKKENGHHILNNKTHFF